MSESCPEVFAGKHYGYPDWGGLNGEFPLDLDFSARALLADRRGHLAGAALLAGILLLKSRGVASADGLTPADGEGETDTIKTAIAIAEKLAFPVLIGLGNAGRVASGRKGEKAQMAARRQQLSKDEQTFLQMDSDKLMADAREQGFIINNTAAAEAYRAKELQQIRAAQDNLSKTAKRYSLPRIWTEATREFIEGALFGVVFQSLPSVVGDFAVNYRETIDPAEKVDIGLKSLGWFMAAIVLAKIAWQTQDPAGRAGAQDKALFSRLKRKGMI